VIRVSVGIDTTEAEVDGFAVAVGECVERLRAGALL
jgi:cysteine sulfinate desulfinase/cysteine desulfurase-like protein